jgi:hypothetical protein
MQIHRGLLLLASALASSGILHGQEPSRFVGTWRQDISAAAKVKTPKELVIRLDGDKLTVITTGPGKVRSINVTFQIGGPEVTYTGLDGDEFHVKVTRDANSLVFDGREHEESRNLPVHEIWTLLNKGERQVLLDTKNAKSPHEMDKIFAYQRVKQ